MYTKYKINFIEKSKTKSNFFCTICTYPVDDFISHEFDEVCNDCYLTFVESRKKEWKDGWRPKKIKIKEHIYIKKKQLNNKDD